MANLGFSCTFLVYFLSLYKRFFSSPCINSVKCGFIYKAEGTPLSRCY
jgi:hypothetical protein